MTPRFLKVLELGTTHTTAKGNTYLECLTDAGTVAFWGKVPDLRNQSLIQRARLPAVFRCECRASSWNQHALWVPQNAEVELIEERTDPSTPGPNLIEI